MDARSPTSSPGCSDQGVASLIDVQPLQVAAWVERQTRTHAAPTAKQRLAAVRHLFDWLVTGQVVPLNPFVRWLIAEPGITG